MYDNTGSQEAVSASMTLVCVSVRIPGSVRPHPCPYKYMTNMVMSTFSGAGGSAQVYNILGIVFSVVLVVALIALGIFCFTDRRK